MAADNFDACCKEVLRHEGGYTGSRADRGNWTGGSVGKGELKGTKYGISAAAYPHLDIKNLTLEEAKIIYRRDYWDKIEGDLLPYGVDLATFDPAVNSGVSRGIKWLQRAVLVPADGVLGSETITAVKAADDAVTINRICNDRLSFLRRLKTWDLYGEGWSKRVESVRRAALGMTKEAEIEPLPPVEPPPVVEEYRFTIVVKGKGPFIVMVEPLD